MSIDNVKYLLLLLELVMKFVKTTIRKQELKLQTFTKNLNCDYKDKIFIFTKFQELIIFFIFHYIYQ